MLTKSFDEDVWEVYRIEDGMVLATFGNVDDADDFIDNFVE